jgi:hypothetical protein
MDTGRFVEAFWRDGRLLASRAFDDAVRPWRWTETGDAAATVVASFTETERPQNLPGSPSTRPPRPPPRSAPTARRLTSGTWTSPACSARKPPPTPQLIGPIALYNLADDLAETKNLEDKEPDKVKELVSCLMTARESGRTRA